MLCDGVREMVSHALFDSWAGMTYVFGTLCQRASGCSCFLFTKMAGGFFNHS